MCNSCDVVVFLEINELGVHHCVSDALMAENLLFRELAGKVTATFNEAQSLGFQDKYESREIIRSRGLSAHDFDALTALRRKLSRNIKSSLSKDYFREDMESKDRCELLADSIIRMVN